MNIGFGMGSFDLHRLLAIPERLWLFNLSWKRLEKPARLAITREREVQQNRLGRKTVPRKRQPTKKEVKLRDRETQTRYCERAKGEKKRACDPLMHDLMNRLEARGGELLEVAPGAISLRSVKRHDAVATLLGPESGPGQRLLQLPRSADDARRSQDPQVRAANRNAVYADYLWRRAVLELALAVARGRGLVSVKTLAVDRGGHYYDAYRRQAELNPESWRDLYRLVGFKQHKDIPDVFKAVGGVLATDVPSPPNRRSTTGTSGLIPANATNGRNCRGSTSRSSPTG